MAVGPECTAGGAVGRLRWLAALRRLDTLVLIIPFVAGILAIDWSRGACAHRRAATIALGLLVLQAVLHSLTVSQPYALRLARLTTKDQSLAALGALAAAVTVVLGLLAMFRLSGRRLPSWTVARAGQIAAVWIVAWLLAWRVGNGIMSHHLVLALTPPGAGLACIGVIWLAGKRDLGIALVTTLLLVSSAGTLSRRVTIRNCRGCFGVTSRCCSRCR